MEVINRTHDKITSNKRVDLAAYFKIESEKALYLSSGFADGEINPYHFIHFINDDERWLFYCNEDNDGFTLTQRKPKKCLLICSASLVALFIKRTKHSVGSKFLIRKTESVKNDAPIFEIMFNKIIE